MSRTFARAAGGVLLTLAVILGVAVPAASAATPRRNGDLRAPSAVAPNTRVAFTGRFTTHVARPVRLEVSTAAGWRTVARGRTRPSGAFRVVAQVAAGS